MTESAVERLTEKAKEHEWDWVDVHPFDLRLLLSERAELLATVERLRGAYWLPVATYAELLSERAELLATVERMRGALEKLIDHADQCMARLDYHDYGMLGDEPIKQARAALTTGEAPNAGEKG